MLEQADRAKSDRRITAATARKILFMGLTSPYNVSLMTNLIHSGDPR
jgi:hypothetical protein